VSSVLGGKGVCFWLPFTVAWWQLRLLCGARCCTQCMTSSAFLPAHVCTRKTLRARHGGAHDMTESWHKLLPTAPTQHLLTHLSTTLSLQGAYNRCVRVGGPAPIPQPALDIKNIINACLTPQCHTQAFKKLVTDVTELEGLPPTALGLAAQQARAAGHEPATAEAGPWLLTLDFPSYYPVMTHAKNRCVERMCVWTGSTWRCCHIFCYLTVQLIDLMAALLQLIVLARALSPARSRGATNPLNQPCHSAAVASAAAVTAAVDPRQGSA
jgi:hypothetical protein